MGQQGAFKEDTIFDTGQVDASLYNYQPLDFDVGLGWPALAKLLVAVVVLVVILLLVSVWLIVRWLARRKAQAHFSEENHR